MKTFKKLKKGFTLVELVVVIAVIAILAAVSVGAYFGVTESANNSKLEQEAKQVYTAIQTVALAPNDHSSLSREGLVITDAGEFETALEDNLGIDVALTDVQDTKDSTKPTICFVTPVVAPALGGSTVYSSFEYYSHEIGGKRAITDVVTGKANIENKEDSSTIIFDNDKTYNLVTAAEQISVGDKIIIAAAEEDVALSTTQNNNNRGETSIYREGERIIANENTQVITIEAGSAEGTYAFNTGSGYLYAASSSSNNLKTQDEIDDNASWKIEINAGVATITAQGTNTRKVMQYNSTSTLFSCYASASQNDLSIYRFGTYVPCEHDFGDNLENCSKCGEANPDYVAPEPQLLTKTISEAVAIANELDAGDVTYDFYQVTGIVNRVEGDSTKVYLTDGENSIQVYKYKSSYENLYQGYTATVKGKIMNFNGNTPEIYDYEYVSHTPVNYSITIPTFENGSVTATSTSEIEWGTKVTLTVTPNEGYSVKKVLINNTEIELNNNTYEITVDRNLTVSVEFVESESVPQTETATITFDDKAKRTQFSTLIQVWEENGIIVTNNKHDSTSNVADYANPARFYKNSQLIVAKDGMVEILFDCYTASHATALKAAIGGSATIVNSSNVRIEFDTAKNSFTVVLTSAQVQLDSITVKYTELNTETHEHLFVEGKCSCGAVDPNYEPPTQEPETKEPVVFEFGTNKTGTPENSTNGFHDDGNDLGTSKTYTEGKYSLNLTSMSKVFGPAYDKVGNSCIKLGTSSKTGTFTFTVPDEVLSVTINVAGYKAATSSDFEINNNSYNTKKPSNDGVYDPMIIDTTSNKTITFVSVTYRLMIDSIVFNFN